MREGSRRPWYYRLTPLEWATVASIVILFYSLGSR